MMKIIDEIVLKNMKNSALNMVQKAYAPYSGFKVGASVLADNGVIYSGCNIENASYGGTICAERVAISKAISEGAKKIMAVVVCGETNMMLTPCGICRQFIVEFATKNTPVYCGSGNGVFTEYTIEDLLPHAFTQEDLS